MTIWCFAEEGEIELCEAELGTLDQRYRTTVQSCIKYLLRLRFHYLDAPGPNVARSNLFPKSSFNLSRLFWWMQSDDDKKQSQEPDSAAAPPERENSRPNIQRRRHNAITPNGNTSPAIHNAEFRKICANAVRFSMFRFLRGISR